MGCLLCARRSPQHSVAHLSVSSGSRFWVDPAPVAAASQSRAAISRESLGSRSNPSVELARCFSNLAKLRRAESAPASRKERIASLLVDLLAALSGRERSQIGRSSTFMEQGFDSLVPHAGCIRHSQGILHQGHLQPVDESSSRTWTCSPIILTQTLPAGILADTSKCAASGTETPRLVEPLGLQNAEDGTTRLMKLLPCRRRRSRAWLRCSKKPASIFR